jgi:streptogramin lyase
VRSVLVRGAPFDVVVSNGRVWTTGFSNGMLVEVDAGTLHVIRRIKLGGFPTGLLSSEGALWVGLGRGATEVVRVDPASGALKRIDVGVPAPTHFVATPAGIWVVDDGNALVLLSRSDGHVLRVAHAGSTLVQPALAPDGTLWVPDKELDRVFRLDPTTGDLVDSFAAGDGAFQVLRAFGSMWVRSYAGNDIWRFRS